MKIRDGNDPYFEAEFLTDSTNEFGMSRSDLLAVGIVGLIVSVLLSFQPCWLFCCKPKKEN